MEDGIMKAEITQYFDKDEDKGVEIIVDDDGMHINILQDGHYTHAITVYQLNSSMAIHDGIPYSPYNDGLRVIVKTASLPPETLFQKDLD